jgi:hypothetical protein
MDCLEGCQELLDLGNFPLVLGADDEFKSRNRANRHSFFNPSMKSMAP